MKYRNGFVSNSSSSSYILAYNKKSVMTDPSEIVDYIENHLRNDILFRSEMAEGEDIFTLDSRQKNYLLNHKKRFIKYNTGMASITDYSADKDENGDYPTKEVPYVTGITEVYDFCSDPYEYSNPEVDMSDIPESDLTLEDHITYMNAKEKDPAIKAKIDQEVERERIRWERQRVAREKERSAYIEKIKERISKNSSADPEDIVIETVSVDYNSCDPDGTNESYFANKYFGLDEDTYYEDSETSDPENHTTRVCPKCGYSPCGTINTGVESCIFCPNCHVRTAYYPVPRHIDLIEDDWDEGRVVKMFKCEMDALNNTETEA